MLSLPLFGNSETLNEYLRNRNITWNSIVRDAETVALFQAANQDLQAGQKANADQRVARDRKLFAYREAGLKLIEAEQRLTANNGSSYGKWLPYLKQYAPDIGERHSQRLMELARVEYDVSAEGTSHLAAEWSRICGNANRQSVGPGSRGGSPKVRAKSKGGPASSLAAGKGRPNRSSDSGKQGDEPDLPEADLDQIVLKVVQRDLASELEPVLKKLRNRWGVKSALSELARRAVKEADHG